MALIGVEGAGIPTSFPLSDDGFAVVSAFCLTLNFQFHAQTVHIDEEVFDPLLGDLTHTMRQLSSVNEEDKVWLLRPGRYRAYGLTDLVMGASTKILISKESSACTVQPRLPVPFKQEPSLQTINELSDGKVPDDTEPIFPPPPTSILKSQSSAGSCLPVSRQSVPKTESMSVVECLRKLASRKGSRNVFKSIDYTTLLVNFVRFLPPRYSGDVIFELPLLRTSSKQSKAKQLRGMDKQYDGHV